MKAQWRSGVFLTIMVTLVFASGAALAMPREELAGPLAPAAPPLSGYIRIEEATVDTLSPAVAYNSKRGEFLAVWEQHIHGGEVAIYGRRISATGEPIGAAFPVIHVGLSQYLRPAVAYSPKQDSYLVVAHRKVGANDYDIWGMSVRGDGSLDTVVAIDIDLDRDWYPAITYNSQHDEFLVVFEKYVSTTRSDVEAHRIKASDWSEPSWRNIAGAANQARRVPKVAYNAARDEYLIAYILNSPPASGGDVVGRFAPFNLGNPLSAEKAISPSGPPSQIGVALAAGPDQYLAVFAEDHGASTYQVWARRITGDRSMDSFISLNASAASRLEAAAAFGEGGHYLVPLRRISSASNWDIFGQFIRPLPEAALEGTEFGIHDVSGYQMNPDVACSPMGRCLVVEEEIQSFGGGDVYNLWGRLVGHYRVFLPIVLRW